MRVEQQVGYILHTRAYRETSQIIEVFTRDYGRIGLIARGVRRERSQIPRALLQPLQPLLFSWIGKGDLPTLSAIEATNHPLALTGIPLFCALYVNELLLRLSARNDTHCEVYLAYENCLKRLASADQLDWTLRRFERDLLQGLGYGLVLDHELDTGHGIDPDSDYSYQPEQAPHPWHSSSSGIRVRGADLLALHQDYPPDAAGLRRLKFLMRSIISYYLGEYNLQSWKMLQIRDDTA